MGINTGIIHNAEPLSTESVKDLEKQVLENQESFAYLNENNELCFALPFDPSLIKYLAWDNAYELSTEGTGFTKKAYKKTGLETFYLDKVLSKSNINDSWSDGSASTPEVLEGEGQEFYAMAPSVLSFRSTAPLNEFQEVQVNGQTVDPSNYTLEEGSTIVKLSHEYLNTLAAGEHEISIVSSNQVSSGNFKIKTATQTEYNFYCNQPYSARINGTPYMFMFKNPECLIYFVSNMLGQTIYEATFTRDNNIFSMDLDCGRVTGYFSNDGMSFICEPFEDWYGHTVYDVVFTICNDDGTADEDYIYQRSTFYNGWTIRTVIDPSKEYLSTPKNNIKGQPVLDIRQDALAECYNLKSFTVPENVGYISDILFQNCPNLEHVFVSENIRSVELSTSSLPSQCFNMYNNLCYLGNDINPYIVFVGIRSGATENGNVALHENTRILAAFCNHYINERGYLSEAHLTLNNGLLRICRSAIGHLYYYNNELPDSLIQMTNEHGLSGGTKYNNALYFGSATNPFVLLAEKANKEITSCVVHKDTKVILNEAFADCTNLVSLQLPTGLRGLGDNFMMNTGITNLHIPETLVYLSENALNGSVLQQVSFGGTVEQWRHLDMFNTTAALDIDYIQCSDGLYLIEKQEEEPDQPILGGF